MNDLEFSNWIKIYSF